MRNSTLRSILLIGAGIFLVACGSSPGESEDAEADDEGPTAQSPGYGGGGGLDLPAISARTFTDGKVKMKVSGFFEVDASPELNKPASLSDGGFTWLQYGASGAETANATITFGDGDGGVVIGLGRQTATGTSEVCSIKIDVTDARVSGHFSCPKVTGYNPADGSMGDVAIEVDFEANS